MFEYITQNIITFYLKSRKWGHKNYNFSNQLEKTCFVQIKIQPLVGRLAFRTQKTFKFETKRTSNHCLCFIMLFRKLSPLQLLVIGILMISTTTLFIHNAINAERSLDVLSLLNTVQDGDIMAGVFWDVDGTKLLHDIIIKEANEGLRDKVCCP